MKGIRVQLICVGKMKEKFYIDAAADIVVFVVMAVIGKCVAGR